MPFSIASTQDKQIVRLEGAVTIRQAQDLCVLLGEGLEEGKPVAVDTAALEDIDTCILQLLCSLRKAVPSLSFDTPCEPFVTALDRCGLRRELLGAQENL